MIKYSPQLTFLGVEYPSLMLALIYSKKTLMIPLVRLAYASTAAGRPVGIRDHLIKLQQKAESFNKSNHIKGMLFYGNNYFFECIEGNKETIDSLYSMIVYDCRHKNIVLLTYEIIDVCHFAHWSMRFVYFEPTIQQFFKENYKKGFNPYLLDKHEGLNKLLNILFQHSDNFEKFSNKEISLIDNKEIGSVLGYKYMIGLGLVALAIIAFFYIIMIYM